MKESNPFALSCDEIVDLPKLKEEEVDVLYYELIENLLIPEGFTDLAKKLVEKLSDQSNDRIIKVRAHTFFIERNYDETIEACDEYFIDQKFEPSIWKLKGKAQFLKGDADESEKTFLKAIRRGASDANLTKSLGLIYVR